MCNSVSVFTEFWVLPIKTSFIVYDINTIKTTCSYVKNKFTFLTFSTKLYGVCVSKTTTIP